MNLIIRPNQTGLSVDIFESGRNIGLIELTNERSAKCYFSHRLERFEFSTATRGHFSQAMNELVLSHDIICIRSSLNRSDHAEQFWNKLKPAPGLDKFLARFKYGDAGPRSSEISPFSIGEVKIKEKSTIWGLARTIDDFERVINKDHYVIDGEPNEFDF